MRRPTVGHVARQVGISSSGVRFLEREGLVRPEHDDETGYRHFDDDDLYTLYQYQCYRQLGMDLPQVRELLLAEPADAVDLMEAHLQGLRDELARVEKLTRRAVRRTSQAIEERFELGERPRLRVLEPYDVPADLPRRVMDRWVQTVPLSFFGIWFRREGRGFVARRVRMSDEPCPNAPVERDADIYAYIHDVPAAPDCLCATFSYPDGTDDLALLDRPLAWLAERGLSCVGDVYGHFLYLRRTSDGGVRYFVRLWLPTRPETA